MEIAPCNIQNKNLSTSVPIAEMESMKTTTFVGPKPLLFHKKLEGDGLKMKTDLELFTKQVDGLTKDQLLNYETNPLLKPFEKKKYQYIESETDLKAFVDDVLANESAIGIDIEQTNTNSYHGYICLIQISTRSKDFIIDALKLHQLIPKYLSPVFNKPDLVKVFYSGGSDLLWLQRDFGLQVLNYFDVHAASVHLDKGKDNSLVGLLAGYCGYIMDKAMKKEELPEGSENKAEESAEGSA